MVETTIGDRKSEPKDTILDGVSLEDFAEQRAAEYRSTLGVETPGPKKRGRKPGSTNVNSSTKKTGVDVVGIEALLFSIHTMLAAATATPELSLSREESNQLALAISNVSRHYAINASAKAVDWSNLLLTLGAIYGSRIIILRLKAQSGKKSHEPEKSDSGAQIFTWPTTA